MPHPLPSDKFDRKSLLVYTGPGEGASHTPTASHSQPYPHNTVRACQPSSSEVLTATDLATYVAFYTEDCASAAARKLGDGYCECRLCFAVPHTSTANSRTETKRLVPQTWSPSRPQAAR